MGNMRLPEGIVTDDVKTFGNLKFSALHSVAYERDEQDNPTNEVRHRTYDLRSSAQEMMIQVILPGELPEKEIPYLAPVKLVNTRISTIANATFGGRAEGSWNVYADDIVLLDAGAEGDATKTGADAVKAGADTAKAGADVAKTGTPQAKKG